MSDGERTGLTMSYNIRLLIDCPDHRGLIAAVSGFIALHNGNILQRPDTELGVRRFAVALLKLGQENWSLLLRSCFPHDLAAVQRLTLAGWFSGRAVR